MIKRNNEKKKQKLKRMHGVRLASIKCKKKKQFRKQKKNEKNIYRCHKSFGLLVNVESDHDAIIKYKG